jgi:hypothetical protein
MANDKTDQEALKEAFKAAAEIAKVVPESMQDAAFHRALDQLLGEETGTTSASVRGRRVRASKRQSTDSGDAAAVLVEQINRTHHPEVGTADATLDRALHVLRIAKDDFGIDGLKASQIAAVLTDKFRLAITRQRINQVLDRAGNFVDRTPRAGGSIYRIMKPGEDLLAAGGSSAGGDDQERSKPRNRKTVARSSKRQTKKLVTHSPTERGTKRRSGRKGPKTAISELIGEHFFTTGRTIGDIQQRLQSKKGLRYRLGDLSPSLVRLMREGSLDREKNEGGQYEYRAP